MALFWKRKKEDRYITLGLNQPAAQPDEAAPEKPPASPRPEAPELASPAAQAGGPAAPPPETEPVTTGAQPAPQPAEETGLTETRKHEVIEDTRAAAPPRQSFSSSILGLDRSMAELQAEAESLRQGYAARFSPAISATRESLSDKIDTDFQGRKVIDAELLDELEEALIAADIGVQTTTDILDK